MSLLDGLDLECTPTQKPVVESETPRFPSYDSMKAYTIIPFDDMVAVEDVAPNMDHGPWIAGGAVISWYRGESVSSPQALMAHDIDVFFANEEQFSTAVAKFIRLGYTQKHSSANAITYHSIFGGKLSVVQLIRKRFFTSKEEIVHNFDIRCVKLITDGKTIFSAPGAIADVEAWRCHFDRIIPETVMYRAAKYMTYGYSVDDDFLLEMLEIPEVANAEYDGDPYGVF